MESIDVSVNLPAIHDYTKVLTIFITILSLTALWKLWKIGRRYANLPSRYTFCFEVVYEYLTNKTKPFTAGIGFLLYRKHTKAYENIPTVSVVFDCLLGCILSAGNIPLTSYVFQKCVELSKRFETEGMFLVWLFRPVLVIFSEEAVKVFSNHRAATDKSFMYDPLKHAMGNGTIVRNGEDWKTRRKVFNPVFYKDVLKSNIFAVNEYAGIMTKELAAVTNKSIYLLDYLKEFSFYVACEFLLGMKMHEGEFKELGQQFQNTVKKLCECSSHRMVHPLMRYKIFLRFTVYGRECLKSYNERNRLISKVLSKVKESISLRSSKTKYGNESGQAFINILFECNLKDPSFTVKDMKDEISTYISAGYETVAHTLLWCLFLLGHHQDIQNKVFKEVQSVTEEFISYDDIFHLKYLECVIKEVLRIHPTVPFYGRHLKEDVQCGKYKIPKDTALCFFPYRLHRNSEIFPDPENFNPDRFLDGCVEKRPWSYVPFAEGIRNCIGKKFAMMEMTVFLAYMIRKYQIQSLVEKESVEFNYGITLSPLKPLFMQLTPRKE